MWTMGTGYMDADHDVAGHNRSSWWQRTTAHLADLQGQINRLKCLQGDDQCSLKMLEKADAHLRAARQAADHPKLFWSTVSGSNYDRAFANIHKVEMTILRLSPEDEVVALGPFVLANARQHLGAQDPRRQKLEARLCENGDQITRDLRGLAVSTLLASQVAEEHERAAARSFRNIVIVAVSVTAAIAGLFILWGYLDPFLLASNLCFTPTGAGRICPSGSSPHSSDVLLVEAFGAGAAAFIAAVSLKDIRGTSTPYSVPVVLVILRLPVGALAALMGLILIRGRFIPGLTDLDTGPQILAWAILFGIAQEGLTRLVVKQGQQVLNNVRGPERAFAPREITAPAADQFPLAESPSTST